MPVCTHARFAAAVHLVDFYVITRNRQRSQVHSYEWLVPKDVVQLDPGAEVALFVEFGPHRGEYMFHCHNLVHEDYEMMRSFNVTKAEEGRRASTAFTPTFAFVQGTLYDT